MLLHRLGRSLARELLDVGRDNHRLNVREALPALVAPSEELPDGLRVGEARVRVSDVDGEELQEARAGPLALAGDKGGEVCGFSSSPSGDCDSLLCHCVRRSILP